MNTNHNHLYIQEALWLVVSVALAIGILYPVTSQTNYLHILPNFLVVVLAFNYLRYGVTFEKLWFLKTKAVRVGWFIINIYLFIYMLNRMELILTAIDSYAVFEVFTGHQLSLTEEKKLLDYIHVEYIVFSMAAFLGIIVYNFRILASFWRSGRVVKEEIISSK